MRNKKNAEATDHEVFSFETELQLDGDPLIAVPAHHYSFVLVDSDGTTIDDASIIAALDAIPLSLLDATSGTYYDSVICSAMLSALSSLADQRVGEKGHVGTIELIEKRERDAAADIVRALNGKLDAYEQAMRHMTNLKAKKTMG